MTASKVIDIDALIVPIEGESPAGSDIRLDSSTTSIYYKIKDARAGARSSERQQLMDDDPDASTAMVSEWETVLATAPEILTSHAKDLEVAAWYTEGLLRQHGLAGLRDGFSLIQALVENFWDQLFPMPDEDGIETRVAALIGLNGEDGDGALIMPINKVPLTEGQTHDPFATWQYEQALDLEKIADPKKKEARISAGAITLEMIQQAVQETPAEFFTQFKDDLDECIDAFASMTAALDERCGHDSPPSSNIRNKLNRLKEVLGFLSKDVSTAASPANTETDAVQQDSGAAQNVATSVTPAATAQTVSVSTGDGVIATREDAHRIMLKVAQFFRATEPHSPVSYALEQAVRWGNMALPELLSELIIDDRARQEFFKTTGIPIEDKKRKK